METALRQEQSNAMTATLSMVTAATPTALLETTTGVQQPLLTSILSPLFALRHAPRAIMLNLPHLLVQLATSAARPAPTFLS